MTTVILIKGRHAIPVRAIPFVTGWSLSPDMVAAWMAHHDEVDRLQDLTAYHLDPDGEPAGILPKEWDGVSAELKALSAKLKSDGGDHSESYPIWRRESVLLLPPGVFVWRDEFEASFSRAFSTEKLTIVQERVGDRQLNMTALVPEELREAVLDGFSLTKRWAPQLAIQRQDETHQTLTACLAGHWDKAFEDLPAELKIFALELEPLEWNKLSSQQRQTAAAQLDWQTDPRCEPSLYWELSIFQDELAARETSARGLKDDGAALVLVDVQKRIDTILATDRIRVGSEIQALRDLKVAHEQLLKDAGMAEARAKAMKVDYENAVSELRRLGDLEEAHHDLLVSHGHLQETVKGLEATNSALTAELDDLRNKQDEVAGGTGAPFNDDLAGEGKPLGTRERHTLLTIIAAMCGALKISTDKPGKGAQYIEGLTDELGAHVSKRAIEEHLKRVPDALGARGK